MGCSEEILSIIAMLQVQSVFSKPVTGQGQITARIRKRDFEVAEGDLITSLNVYASFVAAGRTKEWCGQHYVIYKNLKRAHELRQQLANLCRNQIGMPLISCHGDTTVLRRCITSGFFPNAAYLHHSGVYRTCRGNRELHVHPMSCLYTIRQPQFVVFCELLSTTKVMMKEITVIEADWLTELAPHYYVKKQTLPEDRWAHSNILRDILTFPLTWSSVNLEIGLVQQSKPTRRTLTAALLLCIWLSSTLQPSVEKETLL